MLVCLFVIVTVVLICVIQVRVILALFRQRRGFLRIDKRRNDYRRTGLYMDTVVWFPLIVRWIWITQPQHRILANCIQPFRHELRRKSMFHAKDYWWAALPYWRIEVHCCIVCHKKCICIYYSTVHWLWYVCMRCSCILYVLLTHTLRIHLFLCSAT